MAVAATITYEDSPISTYDAGVKVLFPNGIHDGAGLISHWCEQTDTGWTVHDVWESEEAMNEFLESRVASAGIGKPDSVDLTPVHNYLRTA